MKYEMIFGDEALFDGAPEECILVVRMPGGDPIFYLEKNKSELRGNVAILKYGFIKLAMRRIIKEPKQWTWKDKKAGRLPEVGCLVVNKTGKVSEVVTIKNGYFVLFECGKNNGPLTIHGDLLMNQFKPVETPEERAQREEDEFVEELSSCVSRYDSFISGVSRYDSFINGARAAYRKLKGGE